MGHTRFAACMVTPAYPGLSFVSLYSATLPPQAKELESNAEYYLELLEKGTGKPKEAIEKDILRPKYFRALEAIDYGLADKILDSKDDAFEKPVIYFVIFSNYHATFLFSCSP